jgi:uncharacterized repeat protein (TIGR03803 family)
VVSAFGAGEVSGPVERFIEARDGNFYGVSGSINVSNSGCVFKMTKDGVIIPLVVFNGPNGADPRGVLVEGLNGNFYGTTYSGGTNDAGTVFRMTPQGALTTLVTFEPNSHGYRPESGLTLGSDGNFYGTCEQGGNRQYGTLFKMTPQGEITPLVHFANNAIDGIRPYGGLTLASDGSLYGTTQEGGTSADNQQLGWGSVFRMTLDGLLQTSHSFNRADGAYPQSTLIQGANGWLYGTTTYGGASGNGTVFQISPAVDFTPLVSFSGTDGAFPSGLTLGFDGHFYGTTSRGGTNDVGTIFRLTMPILKTTRSEGNVVVSWRSNQVGFTLQSAFEVDSLNWTNHADAVAVVNGDFVVTNAVAGARFFRLKK